MSLALYWEALAHYPVCPNSARQDHVLPLREPITDVNGEVMTEVFVPKGTVVICALAEVNRSKAIWGEDACEWKPERWLSPLPQTVSDARVPGVYANVLTFAGGARACMYVDLSYCLSLSYADRNTPVVSSSRFWK